MYTDAAQRIPNRVPPMSPNAFNIILLYTLYASIKECIIYNVQPITIICICKHGIRYTMNNYLTSWRGSEIREVVTV